MSYSGNLNGEIMLKVAGRLHGTLFIAWTLGMPERAAVIVGAVISWREVVPPLVLHNIHATLAGDRAGVGAFGEIDPLECASRVVWKEPNWYPTFVPVIEAHKPNVRAGVHDPSPKRRKVDR